MVLQIQRKQRFKTFQSFAKTLLIILILSSIATSMHIEVYSDIVKVNWVVKSDPSPGIDMAFSTCIQSNYLYVVGSENSDKDSSYRIEKRDKVSGELLKVWSYNPTPQPDYLHDCVAVNDRLYVVGVENVDGVDTKEVLLVFDTDLNLLYNFSWNPSKYLDEAKTVVSDGEIIYVISGSIIYDDYTGVVRVRKIKSTGDAQVFEKVSPKGLAYIPIYAAFNPVTKDLWVVGTIAMFAVVEGHTYIFYNSSFLMILDKDLNQVKEVVDTKTSAFHSLSFNENGDAYVVGWNRVVKFDRNGNNVDSAPCNACYKSVYLNSYLYVTRLNLFPENRSVQQVLNIYPANLSYVDEVILSGNYSQALFDYIGKISTDGVNMYIAGYSVEDDGKSEWTVYSLKVITLTTSKTNEKTEPQIYAVLPILLPIAIISIMALFIAIKKKV